LLFATPLLAQTPSDPAGPPPMPPMPDAVSGDPASGDAPSTPTPVTPTPETPGAPGDAATAAAAAGAATAATTPGTTEPAAPEDPKAFSRRGFFFSFGIGTSIINYQLDVREGDALVYAGGITELVPASLLKIGAGVGPQTAAHFTNRIAWLAHNDWAAVDHHERIWTMSSMSGVGVTHFLDKERRSWYIGADLGVSQWLAFSDMGRDLRDIGFGICAEVGTAFFPGLSFEHSVCWGTVESHRRDSDNGTELDADLGMPLTASFTLNYLK
jgi:hypothetical protein